MSSWTHKIKSAVEGKHASRVQRSGPELDARPPAANHAVPPQGNNPPHKKVAKDLWSEAFASLFPEEREVLRPAGRDGKLGDVVSQQVAVEKVMELTEVKYEEFCRRGWHTTKDDTIKETNVRIKAKEIMCSALQFKGIVDAGLKFDPSGYGTIVWGVLSGVLTLVQNDKEKVDAVFDSAAVMARFLPKYAIIEDHYRDRSTQEQNAFEDLIQQVYVAILKYAACVQKELSKSVAGRLLDSFWTLDNQEVKIRKDDLEGKDEIVTSQTHIVAHQYRKLEFQELDGKASEALSKIDISVEKLLKAERLSTLKWLSTPVTNKQQQLRERVGEANDSGKWLLESELYTDWLTKSHSLLWLHGASGCGKSILCSTVVKSLEESAEKNSNMIVAYWYMDIADPPSQNLQRLLRFVLRRISAKATPFPKAVRDLADKHEASDSSPSTTALIKALTETVAALEEDIFLVLDAIDEYQTVNETLRKEFLNFLVMLGDAQMRKLHLLVTSTADTDIVNAFKRLQKPPAEIDVEKPVSMDVDAYLDTKIKEYAEKKHWSPEITDKIYKALKDDGRFRIVSLQLEDLHMCFDDRQIDDTLKSIPRDIGDAYLRKLQSVAPKDICRLSHIFYWISVAVRQLTTFELAAAPGVNLPNPEELTKICPSRMIRLEKQKPSDVDKFELLQQEAQKSSGRETRFVTFDHPSVKRFLYSSELQESRDDQISPFFVSEKTVNAEFASLMVDHLLAIKQPRIESSIFVKSPFLPYVAQHWHEHLKDRGDIAGEDEVLKEKLLMLFGEPMNPAYLNWIRVWNPESNEQDFELAQDSCPSPLFVAVFLRFEGISKHLIDNHSYINGAGGRMHTTLQLALRREYTEIAQQLIAAGEDVDRTAYGQPTALYTAVQSGNAELVQMLLAAGADPDANHAPFGAPLQLASLRGFTKIVDLLVASKAHINLQSGRFGTALQAAAAAGHSEVVAILLENGAKPDVVSGSLGTAIQAAATGGHSEVVKLLAARGIAWDEEKDSIWHKAYDLWISRSLQTKTKFAQSLLFKELWIGSDVQRMLASVLKALSSLPAASNGTEFETRWKSASPEFDVINTKSLELVGRVRRQGQEGMESEHYVYRALFWAMLFRCTAIGRLSSNVGSSKIKGHSALEEKLYWLSIIISLRASDQKMIEHGTSDALVAARHELVECYAMAFRVVTELEPLMSRSTSKFSRVLFPKWLEHETDKLLESVERQDKRFESFMKMARLQEPSTEAALLHRMHADQLTIMRQEMRACFHGLEGGMRERLEEVEQRVVASVRDILPGIIREEMRKLLIEQKGSAGLDDRG